MNTLTISDEQGKELVKLQIEDIDASTATVAIIQALAKAKPRKQRSDKGTKRDSVPLEAFRKMFDGAEEKAAAL